MIENSKKYNNIKEVNPLFLGFRVTKQEFISTLKDMESLILEDQKSLIVKNQDGEAIGMSLNEDYFFDEFNENEMSAYPQSIQGQLLLFGLVRDSLYSKNVLPDQRGQVFNS